MNDDPEVTIRGDSEPCDCLCAGTVQRAECRGCPKTCPAKLHSKPYPCIDCPEVVTRCSRVDAVHAQRQEIDMALPKTLELNREAATLDDERDGIAVDIGMEPNFIIAAEIARRYNAFEALVEACDSAGDWIDEQLRLGGFPDDHPVIRKLTAALALAEPSTNP